MKGATELVWTTLRTMSVYGERYTDNFSDVAAGLFKAIPWYLWPKGNAGELLYDAVFVLAYYSKATVDAWAKKHPNCPYEVASSRNTEPWYWIASWAAANRLDYYE